MGRWDRDRDGTTPCFSSKRQHEKRQRANEQVDRPGKLGWTGGGGGGGGREPNRQQQQLKRTDSTQKGVMELAPATGAIRPKIVAGRQPERWE